MNAVAVHPCHFCGKAAIDPVFIHVEEGAGAVCGNCVYELIDHDRELAELIDCGCGHHADRHVRSELSGLTPCTACGCRDFDGGGA